MCHGLSPIQLKAAWGRRPSHIKITAATEWKSMPLTNNASSLSKMAHSGCREERERERERKKERERERKRE